ncbi:Vps74p [Sporobolomyces salmoneus]|uniref:Vps74p n=1 Tax=Sporobolomyces salmoneus TaxID=183962 RepID=UPI00316EFA35
MASTSTLSRRRGGGGGGGSTLGSEGGGGFGLASTSTPSPSSRPSTPSTRIPSSSSGPHQPSHKVAYDSRDLADSTEELLNPRLTLMEEILLLGLKDKQGYLSFWNDNISYTLRGCIVLELALRHRIAMVRDPNRRRFPLADRYIEVVDDKLTGEVLLDEALKMMKQSERMSVGTWIDLMSGETWNVMKIGYQLKQVRERLAKGLVDKGVLRTEKRNFLLFDMATHPVSDPTFKDDVLRRTLSLLTTRSTAVPTSHLYGESVRYRTIRAVSMVCAAFAANVLENALVHLSYDQRETAFSKCDELLAEFSQWPFGGGGSSSSSSSTPLPTSSSGSRTNGGGGIGTGGNVERMETANLQEIQRLARLELVGQGISSSGSNGQRGGEESSSAEKQTMRELHLEVVAAVLEVYRRMDSLL